MATTNSYIRYCDNLKVKSIKIDTTLYDDITTMMQSQSSKTASTVLYNDFSSEVDAYYFSLSTSFTGVFCSVYRKTYSQLYFDYVCNLTGTTNFKDFNIHNNDYYEYLAFVSLQKSDGTYGYKLYENKDSYDEQIYTLTQWNSWSIMNIKEQPDGSYTKDGDVWILGLNLEGENLNQNLSVTSWDTLGKYPKISMGERNYIGGSVTCLLGKMEEVTNKTSGGKQYQYTERSNQSNTYTSVDEYTKRKTFVDSKYSRELEKYIKWTKFCSDGYLKLLKDIKGNSWIVQIINAPSASLNNQANNIPTTITFEWSEVLGVEEVSILE